MSKENKENKMDALAYVERLNRNLNKVGSLGKAALVTAALVAILSVGVAAYWMNEQSKYVYVIRQNTAYVAETQPRSSVRDKEVYYHVRTFHDKFYNLAPNMETINENINEALGMGDESVLLKDNRRKEQQFYSKLVENLVVEEIKMDSLKVDVNTYPYKAHYYGRLYVIRNTNLSEYLFESTCKLINVPSSSSNLAGLRIENFTEVRRDLVRTGLRR